MLSLRNNYVEASFASDGSLRSLRNADTATEHITRPSNRILSLVLTTRDGYETVTPSQAPDIREADGELNFDYTDISQEGQRRGISLSYTVRLREDELLWCARISNDSPAEVREFRFPIVGGVAAGSGTGTGAYLYWPEFCGTRIPDPAKTGESRWLRYPRASMQWYEYGSDREGLYFASLDQTLQTTRMEASSSGGHLYLSWTKYPFLNRPQEWNSPTYVLSPHSGDWHTGARKYRKWAESWIEPPAPPDWVRESQGWLLLILKQQNGQVIWRYRDISRLLDMAQRSGLDHLGLFGWAEGGHDHLYPRYDPDALLGGEEELRRGLKEARSRGGHCTLYTNGQLMDTGTGYYQDEGFRIAAKTIHGTCYSEHWKKYSDHPGYVHAIACPSTREWRELLVGFAKSTLDLGAQGIIFDQIGGGSRADMCHDCTHEHAKPCLAIGAGIAENLKTVRENIKRLDPDFCIVTEAPSDALCQHVDMIHGSGAGFSDSPVSFPALFRYTFPDYIMTNRIARPAPYMNFAEINFAFVYGFRFDLECRYKPDAELILSGVRPDPSDYENITGPPEVKKMCEEPVDDYENYMKELCSIRNRHRALLTGRFTDSDGFTIDNAEVTATAFNEGLTTAVVVWNKTPTQQVFEVDVPESRLMCHIRPGARNAPDSEALPPNRLAVLVFRRFG